MAYWSRSQGKIFDKIYRQFDTSGKPQQFSKMYEPGIEKNQDRNFKIQKVLELGNVSRNVSWVFF